MKTTETEMLRLLVDYVKSKKLRIASPDYLRTHFYSPQWGVFGNRYYYQLPNNGRIIAYRKWISPENYSNHFSLNGFSEKTIYAKFVFKKK